MSAFTPTRPPGSTLQPYFWWSDHQRFVERFPGYESCGILTESQLLSIGQGLKSWIEVDASPFQVHHRIYSSVIFALRSASEHGEFGLIAEAKYAGEIRHQLASTNMHGASRVLTNCIRWAFRQAQEMIGQNDGTWH